MGWIGDLKPGDKPHDKKPEEKTNDELSRFGFQIEHVMSSGDGVIPYPFSRLGMIGIYAADVEEATKIFQLFIELVSKLAEVAGEGNITISDVEMINPEELDN